jgi:hypothetical protein
VPIYDAPMAGDPNVAAVPAAPARAGAILILALGAAIAVAFGAYARVHDPTGESVVVLFFSGQIQLKVWLATVSVALAVVQVVSALWLYGRLGSPAPPWLGDVHRLSGTLAFLSSLPIAYHCLWSLGYTVDPTLDRVLVHVIAGCIFYGAFASKVLLVRSSGMPGWALPAVGGVVFTALVVVWMTSSLWFFANFDGPKL